jgi:hypothetical protein
MEQSARLQRVCSEELIDHFLSSDHGNLSSTDLDRREENLFRELRIWNGYLAQVTQIVFSFVIVLLSQQDSVDGIAHPSFTLADIFFFPELALAVYFGLTLQSFPCLSE